ncbi:MAG: sigma-54 dependent transcriptional regulator [Catalinimonas sp.]
MTQNDVITQDEIQRVKLRFSIIGNAPQLNHAIQVAMQVAPTDLTVLITGESGTGKESFSKIIHQLSLRKHGQFIAINCGAIPEGTIDSELFGHERGAFTGATDARKGYFEVTDGGTIFLDEIGEMPLGTQARLLRVLENGEFIRVGSSKVQKTNVRVVAATNVNLFETVQRGGFREDLYYRLNTVPIFVPPLRDRDTDAELLFRKFAGDFAERYRVQPLRLTDDARQVLLHYRFPGNIRQLRNLVEQMSVLVQERTVDAEQLRRYLPDQSYLPAPMPSEERNDGGQSFSERDLLYKVLFDMRKDITDLKGVVYQFLNGERDGHDMIKDHPDLFHELDDDIPTPPRRTPPPAPLLLDKYRGDERTYDGVEDITHEPGSESVEESLSLEDNEREMIIKALRKNNNKRKYAAGDLGISERTLYRKIKQYEIENV